MREKNKYYIKDNAGLTGEKLANMKKNNYYVYRALTNIYKSVEDNNPKIGGPFRSALLAGELQRSDTQTGFNTNNLGAKLKYLVASLNDPASVAKFKKSFLYQNILEPMSCGTQAEVDDQWLNFKHTNGYDPAFKNKSSLDAALICQRDDMTAPFGLDFSKLIDTFVQTDRNGNYYLEDKYTIEEEIAGDEAMHAQLKSLKSNERFKASYLNPKETTNYLEDDSENNL